MAGQRSRINARCRGEREGTGACEQLARRTAAAARARLAECLTLSSSAAFAKPYRHDCGLALTVGTLASTGANSARVPPCRRSW